jgi:hypothetical protein
MQRLADLDDDERRLIGPYLTVDRPSSNEYRGFCRECEEPNTSKSPSASYNFIRGEWHCMKNDCGGTISKLIGKLKRQEREAARAASNDNADVIDIKTRRKQPDKPLPTEKQLDGYCAQLRAAPRLVAILHERRGLSDETIERYKIGFDSGRRRYTLPVYDRSGELVNLRLYNPTAKGDNPKMLPFAVGYGTMLFNAEVLDGNDEVVLSEGEFDAIINCQYGIPTVTHTGGAGSFQMSWAPAFAGKHVFICFDDDDGGRKGALRTARMLRDVAAGVYIVSLPKGKPKGDITDFYLGGGTAEQFRSLMEEARLKPFAQDDSDHVVATTGKHVTLEESQSTKYDEPLELDVLIAGKQTPPYLAPKRIHATCDQQKGKVCGTCPMAAYNGDRTLETQPDDPRLLQFIESSETSTRAVLRSLTGAMCSDRIEYQITEQWPIEELVVVQSLDHRNEESQSPMNRKVFNVNTYRSGVNTTARLVGRQVADPRNSRGIFHSWHLEPVQADIDEFDLDDEMLDELAVFQCDKGQSPLDKCKEIAHDLSANVTQIYGRELLHIAYDLVFHSALDFRFLGKRMDKGWLEAIVIGDTRTGKSETASMLCNHYNAGIVKSCEGATFAGLVGGAQPSPQGKSWMVTWGTIPLNDRRLVVLDELSGLISAGGESRGIIEQMSSIRSSGRAQLTKIVSEETSARTRLLWISNPLDGKRLADMPGGGMEAIRKLVKNPEDIARFDFALAVSNSEVPSEIINAARHNKVEHQYTDDLCSKLLMWVWSRKTDQIKFAKGAEDEILAAAQIMGNKYIPEPPLVQIENIRMKLARIAVAFAARTFSTNRNATNIVVRPEHVHSAVEFLEWAYGTEVMGYGRMSRRITAGREEAKRNQPAAKAYLRKNEGMLDALRAVMYADSFRPRDFDEFGGMDIDAKSAVQLLLQWKMVRRLTSSGGRIVLEPAMIEVLKQLEDEGV